MLSSLSNQTKGTLYCVVGVLAVTPNALMVRKVNHMPIFAVQFFGYMIFSVTVSLIFILQEGRGCYRKFVEIGWLGWLAGLVFGAQIMLITLGFQKTAAATALVILASNPMFSALFSFFILKEAVPLRTVLASVVCFGSIVLIFASQIGEGAGVEGIIYSLLASILIAVYFVLLRLATMFDGKEPDMRPCTIIAGWFSTFIAICNRPDLSTAHGMDWLYLFINGVLVLSISFSLWTIGPSLISAPEVSLYTLIETILGPVWVWLGGYEAPPVMSVYGGVALILALTIHSVIGIREENQKRNKEHKALEGKDEVIKDEEAAAVVVDSISSSGGIELVENSENIPNSENTGGICSSDRLAVVVVGMNDDKCDAATAAV